MSVRNVKFFCYKICYKRPFPRSTTVHTGAITSDFVDYNAPNSEVIPQLTVEFTAFLPFAVLQCTR